MFPLQADIAFDWSMISDMAIPLIPVLVAIVTGLYVVARKSWKNEQTLKDVHKEVCGDREHPELGLVSQVRSLTDRLNVLQTQFEPFLKILDDSLSRMMLGGIKGNPIDPAVLRKIKLGLATAEEIDAFDASLVKEIEENGAEALPLVVVRYWVALKKAETEDPLGGKQQ